MDKRPKNQTGEYLNQEDIGILVKDHTNVKIIKQEFTSCDFKEKFDFIFIDGNHSYSSVFQDTTKALTLINKPGIICWHDCNNVKDVNNVLSEINAFEAVTLHNTWIAYANIK